MSLLLFYVADMGEAAHLYLLTLQLHGAQRAMLDIEPPPKRRCFVGKATYERVGVLAVLEVLGEVRKDLREEHRREVTSV